MTPVWEWRERQLGRSAVIAILCNLCIFFGSIFIFRCYGTSNKMRLILQEPIEFFICNSFYSCSTNDLILCLHDPDRRIQM